MPVVRIMIQNVGAMNLGGYYRRCGDLSTHRTDHVGLAPSCFSSVLLLLLCSFGRPKYGHQCLVVAVQGGRPVAQFRLQPASASATIPSA